MTKLRSPLVGILMVLLMAMMAGCAARSNARTPESAIGSDEVVVDLPAIVLDVGEGGQLSAAESASTALNPLLNLALADASLPADLAEKATAGGTEHIQLEITPNGMSILVDNQPVLTPLWNQEVLSSTASALQELDLGDSASMLRLLPLMQNVGAGVILKFPAGNEAGAAPPQAGATLPSELPARPGSSTPINIVYNTDGSWNASGLPPFMPIPWDQILTLPGDTVQNLTDSGIESLQITTGSGGIFLRVNGHDLPFLDWTGNRLLYTLQVLSDLGLVGEEVSSMLPTLQGVLPLIQGLSLDLTLNFPQ